MTVKLKITTKWTLKMLELGMVSSFHPHGMCKRVEGYGKNWTHFVYKLDNLCRSIRVSNENSSVTWALHFFKLITTPDFFAFRTHHSKQHHQFSKLSDIICYFLVIYRFVYRAKWPWNWKSLQNELWKCWNLAWYHHFTRIVCAKE